MRSFSIIGENIMKIYLEPSFGDGEDEGDGGVRRVIEAQLKHLPAYGVEFVPLEEAELDHVYIARDSKAKKESVDALQETLWNCYLVQYEHELTQPLLAEQIQPHMLEDASIVPL